MEGAVTDGDPWGTPLLQLLLHRLRCIEPALVRAIEAALPVTLESLLVDEVAASFRGQEESQVSHHSQSPH